MILDQPERFGALDPQDMLAHIGELPSQLEIAWEAGQRHELPEAGEIRQVLIAGMGGSAIGGDLLAAYAAPQAKVPLAVWRNYDLPGYIVDRSTLVLASSHSGNTEETLSAFERAREAGATLIAVTTGGELAKRAESASVPIWNFAHDGQPRSAVGFSFTLLLAGLSRMGLLEFSPDELFDTVAAMRQQEAAIAAEVPVASNLAKRMAGQLMDRWPTFIAADLLAPVARRWRTQVAEIAKAVAQYEELPEADHNMVAGVENPESLFGPTMVVFLRSTHNHTRNLARLAATREILMLEGFNTDVLEAQGTSRLAHQWTCLHLGDYVSYYLAMTYHVDPTPVAAIEELKLRLRDE